MPNWTSCGTGEERRLTEAEEECIDSHAVDAEEDTGDDIGRYHDDLHPHTPSNTARTRISTRGEGAMDRRGSMGMLFCQHAQAVFESD